MINAIRSEWIKTLTIRMNTVLFIIAIAIPLIICGLTAALSDADSFAIDDIVSIVTGTSVITGMLLGVIGASSITGEFGFNTIRPTFAATPKRPTVLVAKAIVIVIMAAVAETAIVLVSYAMMRGIISGRGGTVRPFTPFTFNTESTSTLVTFSTVPPMIGVVIFAILVSLLGYAIGLLIHNTPAAIAVLILWPLVLESIVVGILSVAGVDNAQKFMPYLSGINLGNPTNTGDTLGRVGGGLYFGAVTVGLLVFGGLLTNRRDA